MTDSKIFKINGEMYYFNNESRRTRNGFMHESKLFFFCDKIKRYLSYVEKRYYWNRTWERYEFQSAMIGAAQQAYNERRTELLDSFKADRGYTKMTKKRMEEFIDYLFEIKDERLNDLANLIEQL